MLFSVRCSGASQVAMKLLHGFLGGLALGDGGQEDSSTIRWKRALLMFMEAPSSEGATVESLEGGSMNAGTSF